MKWQLKEPMLGDIIRVRAGSIYHYGIYVSDSEVIQFGLSTTHANRVADRDVEVCVSDIDNFLLDGFLEVGASEKKDGKRYSPQKIIKIARSKLGEKGYNIIYNNCEHFAYECYCGKKVSSQIEGVRSFFKKFPVIDVYIARIPNNEKITSIYPEARQKEIDSVSNNRIKTEKYFVWKLLEYAIDKSFSQKISNVSIWKSESGKWLCNMCEFSLSHSDDLVCVAISKSPVGVDIEKIKQPQIDLSRRILTEKEYEQYSKLSEEEKIGYAIGVWTKKESLFKLGNLKSISLNDFVSLSGNVFQKTIYIDNDAYSLSVASDGINKINLYENIKLLYV